MTSAGVSRTSSFLGIVLVVLVIVLTFFLASFPARNSDLWVHLAVGRALWTGQPNPGLEALQMQHLHDSQDWLFGTIVYAIFSVGGGPALVLAKAVIAVILAILLVRSSRRGADWRLPVLCTGLALLAMANRLLVQPILVSYLLLAVCWFVSGRNRSSSLFPPWTLLATFLVWANCDSWFVLGLAFLALLWLGQVLDGETRWSAFVVRIGLLAGVCLINPVHYESFLKAPLQLFGQLETATPFSLAYWNAFSHSPAGMAYFPLLALGLLSFALNYRNLRWGALLPWTGLALLSAYQFRAIPFFAVVAGPVLAWNLHEFFVSRHADDQDGAPALVTWPVDLVTLVLGLAFVVCAWPGWLQMPPFEPRRWAFEPSASLERGAQETQRWREQGKLQARHKSLHLSPESMFAWCWHHPDDSVQFDAKLIQAILADPGAAEIWGDRLRERGIHYLVAYDADRPRFLASMQRLLSEPKHWPLIHLVGDVAIFGWLDPQSRGGDSFAGWALDFERLAFQPNDRPALGQARSEADAKESRWWDVFWRSAPVRPVERHQAAVHLLQADLLRQQAPYRHQAAWEGMQATGLVAGACSWNIPGAMVDLLTRSNMYRPRVAAQEGAQTGATPLDRAVFASQSAFVMQRDDTSPALLYLALRSARRAVDVDPKDAQAQLLLGECYLRLMQGTRERSWAKRFLELGQIRRNQAIAAFYAAVQADPQLAPAHLHLSLLFGEMGFRDLAFHHQKAYVAQVRQQGPPPGTNPEAFRAQLQQFEQQVARQAEAIDGLQAEYQKVAGGLRVLEKAHAAVNHSLVGKARDLLLDSDVSAFGGEGMSLELNLLLKTGRPKEVRDWLEPEQRELLGTLFFWMRAQASAALGDHVQAVRELTLLADVEGEARELRTLMSILAGRSILDGASLIDAYPVRAQQLLGQSDLRQRVGSVAQLIRQQADATTLRGILALEAGDIEEAEIAFRQALDCVTRDSTAASPLGLDFAGRAVAETCLRWITGS